MASILACRPDQERIGAMGSRECGIRKQSYGSRTGYLDVL